MLQLPKKIPLWNGRKQFSQEPNVCVQMSYDTFEVIGNENCLTLNVYTVNRSKMNKRNSKHLMPVLFWIHGGSFNINTGQIERPDDIVERVTSIL